MYNMNRSCRLCTCVYKLAHHVALAGGVTIYGSLIVVHTRLAIAFSTQYAVTSISYIFGDAVNLEEEEEADEREEEISLFFLLCSSTTTFSETLIEPF